MRNDPQNHYLPQWIYLIVFQLIIVWRIHVQFFPVSSTKLFLFINLIVRKLHNWDVSQVQHFVFNIQQKKNVFLSKIVYSALLSVENAFCHFAFIDSRIRCACVLHARYISYVTHVQHSFVRYTYGPMRRNETFIYHCVWNRQMTFERFCKQLICSKYWLLNLVWNFYFVEYAIKKH